MATDFAPTERTRLRRRPQRAAYDEETIFRILDANIVCHIGTVIDGHPHVTPTAYWRDGRHLYWHGSAAGSALHAQQRGEPVCITVSQLDGFLLGRSGFSHSILYRSVMVFGTAQLVPALEDKRRAMNALIERLYPGRTAELRPIRDAELHAISVLTLAITEVSAKIRVGPVVEKEDADYASPCWAGALPVQETAGVPEPDARLAAGTPLPAALAAYAPGVSLHEALLRSARRGQA